MNEFPGFIHTCIDRYPPLSSPPESFDDRLAGLKANLWPEHQRALRVRFLGGDPRLHRRIAEVAQRWTQHAAIRFIFDNSPDAPIRVGFVPELGTWSYIGTGALDPTIGRNEPTINFSWLKPDTQTPELRRVVLHEFGHALGLIHEHQGPAASIPWNKEKVYTYYAGAPNFWTREQVDWNIFYRYSRTQTNATAFDPQSIMVYPIPPEFTDGKFTVAWNLDLSPIDRAFIGQIYPFDGRE